METTPKHWAAPNHRYSSKTYSAASATSHKTPLRRSSPSVSQHVASGEERAPQKFYQVEILDSYKKEGVPPPFPHLRLCNLCTTPKSFDPLLSL